jgi:hypothetical protein
MTADTPDLDRLDALAGAATQGPWSRGDRWHVAGVNGRFGKDRCAYCGHHGQPTWIGQRDINGTKMLAHVHTDDEPWHKTSVYAEREDGPVTVIVETDEYGEMTDEDAAFIVAADPTTVLALTAELRDLRAKVAAVEALADLLTEQGEHHVEGCRGQADCARCVQIDLRNALNAKADQ